MTRLKLKKMTMKIASDMIIPLLDEGIDGRCYFEDCAPSVRSHLRPLGYVVRAEHVFCVRVLDNVGAGMGEGGYASNFCGFRVPYGQSQGETQ